MSHKGTVKLKTKRLILRKFEIADAEAMYGNWAGDPEVTKYLTWQTHSGVEATKQLLSEWLLEYSKPDHYNWAIVLKTPGEPIGSISVVNVDDRVNYAEIGYCLGQNWWNKGYMTEALTAVIKFLFEQVGANRIAAVHDANNPISGKVMLKCGLKYEGLHRQDGRNNQGICDLAEYAILAEDYFAN
ncbi:MAG: GNAT family N-acetyltransferase [Oscillospiraceae bacterium]|nr:GNAT family N-acetyltransferase [Oscillospiraceae bacterium]